MILLLAAGLSTRMEGRDKLLERIDHEPLLRRMARRAARCDQTRVVIGEGQKARRDTLDGLNVEIVEVTAAPSMSASIAAGLSGIHSGSVMIVLADMPEIEASDLHLLGSLHAQGAGEIIRAASQAGKPGHPVVFSEKYLDQLRDLDGDKGARGLLESHSAEVVLVPLKGERALVDLDTPAEWQSWRSAQGAS